MNSTLDQLRLQWPNRHALTAEEVALVLGKKATRGSIEHLRGKMKNGHYPGAKKIDGRWQLPLPDLAKVLDGESASNNEPAKVVSSSQTRSGRLRSAVGPYIKFVINGRFWIDVFASLGDRDVEECIGQDVDLMLVKIERYFFKQRAIGQRDRLLNELSSIEMEKRPKDSGPLI